MFCHIVKRRMIGGVRTTNIRGRMDGLHDVLLTWFAVDAAFSLEQDFKTSEAALWRASAGLWDAVRIIIVKSAGG